MSVYERPFLPAPEKIVQDGDFLLGSYAGPALNANMVDVERPYHYPIPLILKHFRCKEWRTAQFGDSRFFINVGFYNGKTFSIILFNAYDRISKKSWEYKRVLPPRGFGINDKLDGEKLSWRERGFSLSLETQLAEGIVLLEVNSANRGRRPSFVGSFRFAYNARQTAPTSVCMPLGLNRAMYSFKVLMPMEGYFQTKEEYYNFASNDSMGVLGDRKGFYPFALRYDWVSGFGVDSKGRRVGFSLTEQASKDKEIYNENLLWINSRAFPLPPVRITLPQGPEGIWHIQDMEGLVDLVFKPEKKNSTKMDTIIMAMDYHGPYGSFEGILRSPDGAERVDAKYIFGMGEKMYLRA